MTARAAATWGWLGWALFGAACRSDPPLGSCADSLAGVWRTEPGDPADPVTPVERYHIVETATGVEIYAMFDTTRPPAGDKATSAEVYAPVVFDLTRTRSPGGAGLHGTRSQRVTRDGVSCPIRVPAEIADCDGRRITLRYEVDRGVDWERCRTRSSGHWRSLSLSRE